MVWAPETRSNPTNLQKEMYAIYHICSIASVGVVYFTEENLGKSSLLKYSAIAYRCILQPHYQFTVTASDMVREVCPQ